MTTYSAIANSEIDADSPITAALMSKIRDNPLAMAEQTSGAPTTAFTRLYHAQEKLAANTASNTSITGGSYAARRDLVEVVDTLGATGAGGGSIGGANNTQITLPAGTYWIAAHAIAEEALNSGATTAWAHRLYWYNTSDTSDEVVGMATYVMQNIAASAGTISFNMSSIAPLFGKFTIAASKTFELRHYSSGTVSGGRALNYSSQSEIYADIMIWQTTVG